ncbi:nucleoside triphosphate pyrophosphohydrolase [Chengkuizengella axinellae]|uniref:Nucleoside triphosphate pyrophosphohydrolase n=1 Tax=Chengkuizengella axinellae TaxID=3064388 RepID=A0ABT9J5R0_9BACL|nr:nucleoside triphosphate pyrophosphohydrolase [Chengkuizengella sp. 2205SS18-9]MDP5276952.1 nucleoside triphosphate pyrophosphohydrolase [Chengkuizengella sp. 2205SS18-9]
MSLSITIVGLGSGDENQLSLGVWRVIQQSEQLYLRTKQHPVVQFLEHNQVAFQSFDHLYESYDSFPEVYKAIVSELTQTVLSNKKDVVYAVPGHPMLAESTVQMLKEECDQTNIQLHILGGESFLDQTFLRFGFDPIDGFQLLDASEMKTSMLQPQLHTIIAQVYDSFVASDVKLTLMEVYPDDYEIVVGHALGVAGQEKIEKIPLYELDHDQQYGNLSLIWVPKNSDESLLNKSFERLREVVRILRSPEGCPWDQEQTHQSIRKNLIEETYEVLETIDEQDSEAMCEELGDLLMQVMLHAQMEEELGSFTIDDVVSGLNEKLIRRHPHVFGDKAADNSEEALRNWEQMKKEEKLKKGIDVDNISILSSVPSGMPSLMKALEYQKRAAKVGFDWDNIDQVFEKVMEELNELKEELQTSNHPERKKEELGDLIFSFINLARFLKMDPDEAISIANQKFFARFSFIEQELRLRGKKIDQTNILEMEKLWQEAKQKFSKK